MSEEPQRNDAEKRDRAATRRDVDASIRDRMADDDMPDAERHARSDAARDRMAAMRDRQASARDRAEPESDSESEPERRRPSEPTDDA